VKRLNEVYADYFNYTHRRSGHLFQGRFKGILVERESHLLELVRYVVLNPVRCGAVKYAGEYERSNYRATAGLAVPPEWLEIDWTLNQMGAGTRAQQHEAYRRFVADGRGASYDPWEAVVGQIYLGREARSHRPARKALALLGTEECGLTLTALGEWMQLTPRAVAHLVGRGKELSRSDRRSREPSIRSSAPSDASRHTDPVIASPDTRSKFFILRV
jgi:hypothetical protein